MRAIRIEAPGGPEALTLADVPLPEPGTGEVRVEVAAAGVNFIDVYQRSGEYARPLPFTPGLEAAGVVDAVGEGVDGVDVGDRVAWAMAGGSYAEHAIVAADLVVHVPDAVALDTAAAVMLQGMTAQYLTRSTFPLEPGHVALVHAAAGGVGLLHTQLAALRGATVLATVSSDEKAQLAADAGAAATIRYDRLDVADEVRRLEPDGIDVVYDSVGADTFHQSIACLGTRGMLVLYGQSSGPVPPFDVQELNRAGSLFLTRPSLAHYCADADERGWRAREVFEAITAGDLEVRIGETHPLAEAATAHERLEARRTTGKVLLRP